LVGRFRGVFLLENAKKSCRLFFESKKLYICDRIHTKPLFGLMKCSKRPDKGHGYDSRVIL